MASLVLKHGKWYARIKGHKQPGRWSLVASGYPEAQRSEAQEFADAAQAEVDARARPADLMTFSRWMDVWIERRKAEGTDWKKDLGRLKHHVLPTFAHRELASITSADVANLIHMLRFSAEPLAPRTVRNVYSALSALMRDAAIDGRIPSSPCLLTKKQLGSVVDKDPEWRGGAVFTRAEAEQMISDPRIAIDRQVVYGFGLLAGLRPGEAAALRWRHYAPAEPLGRLTIALSYSTSYSKTKRTKTETTKTIPVHPALAALLEAWRVEWAVMFGHAPGPDDLIIPLPPWVKRTKRTGERFRGWDYSGRMWRNVDLKTLGWRPRSVYDTKSTFITLAIEDGANPDVIRERVTHTKPRRDAFDGYDRGPHWAETCREVAKLQVARRVTVVSPFVQPTNTVDVSGSGGGFRRPDSDTISPTSDTEVCDSIGPVRTSCDEMFHVWSHGHVTAEGDEE
jgi:integrase